MVDFRIPRRSINIKDNVQQSQNLTTKRRLIVIDQD